MRIIHKFDTEDLMPQVVLQYEDSTNTLYANGIALSGGAGGAGSVLLAPAADQIITGTHALIGIGHGYLSFGDAYDPTTFEGAFDPTTCSINGFRHGEGLIALQAAGAFNSNIDSGADGSTYGFEGGVTITTAENSGAFPGTAIGVYMDADPEIAAGSSYANVYGGYVNLGNYGAGTIDELTNIYISSSGNFAGGVINNLYGIHIQLVDDWQDLGHAPAVNSAAIQIDDQGSTSTAINVAGGKNNLGPQATTMGNAIISSMPTSDPHVVGQLWNSSGVVHVSAG